MGEGQPRSPCPYKYHPNQGKKKGEEKRKNGKKQEGNREREKPIVLREKQPKLRNTKTGDINWETERDKWGEGRKGI